MKREQLEVPLEVFPGDQIFTHTDDDGVKRTFFTSAMQRVAAKYGGRCEQIIAGIMPMNDETVHRIKTQIGVEQARVDRLVEPYLSMPVIGIQWPGKLVGGKSVVTIVDGNHRIVKLAQLGRPHYNCFVFTHPFWEEFLSARVHEIGPHSGIIEAERKFGCGIASSPLLSSSSALALSSTARSSSR